MLGFSGMVRRALWLGQHRNCRWLPRGSQAPKLSAPSQSLGKGECGRLREDSRKGSNMIDLLKCYVWGSRTTLLLASRVQPRLCSLLHTSWGSPLYTSGHGTKLNSRGVCIQSVTLVFGVGCEVQDSVLQCMYEALQMETIHSNTMSPCPELLGKW